MDAKETMIVRRLVDVLMKHHWIVEVRDEEERVVDPSDNRHEIMDGIGHTDVTYLVAYRHDSVHPSFHFQLIGGNGEDVISDYWARNKSEMDLADAIFEEVMG